MPEDKNRSKELEELRRQNRSAGSGGGIEDLRVIGDKRIAKSTIDEAEESAKAAKKKLDELMTTLELNIGKQAKETPPDSGPPKWADAEELKRRRREEAALLRAEAARAARRKAASAAEPTGATVKSAGDAKTGASEGKKEPDFSALADALQIEPAAEPAEEAKETKAPETEESPRRATRERSALESTAEFNRRSIIETIQMDKSARESGDFDPINKDMLAPGIERGVSFSTEEIAIELEAKSSQEDGTADSEEASHDYTANHPLFSAETISFDSNLIPPEKRKPEKKAKQAGEEKRPSITSTIETDLKRVEKKGLLNVRDNVDDSFREFFGETVIIDRESLGEKAGRQRKIKDFVLSDGKSGLGGPVFEDDEETESGETEYRSDEDTEPVLKELGSAKARLMLRTALSGVLTLVLTAINLLAEFRVLPEALSAPAVFYAINAVLLLGVILINVGDFISGLASLFSIKSDGLGAVSFSALLALAEAAALLFASGEESASGCCAFIAAIGLFACAFGRLLDARRVYDSFITVSENYDKYASSRLEDGAFTRRITRELEVASPRVLIKRKTGFTDNFLKHSYSRPKRNKNVSVISFVLALLCLAGAGVAGYLSGDFIFALRCAAAAAAFCAPFIATLNVYLPIFSMQKNLSKYSAVVPGYSAAGDICSANCVVLEGRELFPKGNVMLHGIKTFERERIDRAILYAASVIIQSCDTLSHVFMNVIQSKTEMLYKVDSVEYEGGRGYSFWIDKTRLLLGTRELLTSHEIDVPSRDYENRYTKTSTRDAIYLAVAGRLYAMFVVSYSPTAEVESALHSFEREGVSLL
ncbi:MAG: hypothetical protein Q4B42_06330, partial [Oscillospiraceae bacterium]|nr:hypothetical protein [Oscillospiraceae bacterium]